MIFFRNEEFRWPQKCLSKSEGKLRNICTHLPDHITQQLIGGIGLVSVYEHDCPLCGLTLFRNPDDFLSLTFK